MPTLFDNRKIINTHLFCMLFKSIDDFLSRSRRIGGRPTHGHLPREITRFTRFLVSRKGIAKVTVVHYKYRRSPLIQCGLQIPATVGIELESNAKNELVLEHLRHLYMKVTTNQLMAILMIAEKILGNYQTTVTQTVTET